MSSIYILIIGVLIAIVMILAVLLLKKKTFNKNSNLTKRTKIEEEKKKILEFLTMKETVTNDEVQTLLNVSHSTATRYLQELEDAGKIVQKNEIGRNVYYQKTLD